MLHDRFRILTLEATFLALFYDIELVFHDNELNQGWHQDEALLPFQPTLEALFAQPFDAQSGMPCVYEGDNGDGTTDPREGTNQF